ncbi:MAG: crosslink repair DNA glycosylase YcaQ family protein [Anaerolineales bacterium]
MELELNRQVIRRLAVTQQKLAGPTPKPTEERVLRAIKALGCVQIDPMRVVERSHRLALWSRLGPYDPSVLDTLRWQRKALFEYWAHAASIVLTENLPIHRHQMAAFATRDSVPARRQRRWLADNQRLHAEILDQLRRQGPLSAGDIGAAPAKSWQSTGWTDGRGVRHMLELMWRKGEVVVAGRDGRGKQYALPEDWFGSIWRQDEISEVEARGRIAEIAVRALGAGTARHIERHFVSGLDPDLNGTLDRLVDDGRLIELRLVGNRGQADRWYAHADAEQRIRTLSTGDFEPRTTLLSPFDNLICDRKRTQQLFDFVYSSEIYVPKAKRVYGHYVMPILDGDRLVGRVDPKIDRGTGVLHVNAIHAEPGTNKDAAIGRRLGQALASLAEFLKADDVHVSRRVPTVWRKRLMSELG